jgi:hypothetical protein
VREKYWGCIGCVRDVREVCERCLRMWEEMVDKYWVCMRAIGCCGDVVEMLWRCCGDAVEMLWRCCGDAVRDAGGVRDALEE